MSNESVFLPAAVRDRIWDLLKERKVTQAELAARIGCSESSLSRFISGKTDKLGDENILLRNSFGCAGGGYNDSRYDQLYSEADSTGELS